MSTLPGKPERLDLSVLGEPSPIQTMNVANQLHQSAMELSARADLTVREGRQSDAKSLFREAMEKEHAAALLVPSDMEPTRSVLLRSAASLALECQEFRVAEKLIGIAVSGDPPEEIAEEIQDLYQAVNSQRNSASPSNRSGASGRAKRPRRKVKAARIR